MKSVPCVVIDEGRGWHGIDRVAALCSGADILGLVGDGHLPPSQWAQKLANGSGATVVRGAWLRVSHAGGYVEGVAWPTSREVELRMAKASRAGALSLQALKAAGAWWMPWSGPSGERWMCGISYPLMGVADEKEAALAEKYGRKLDPIRPVEKAPKWLMNLAARQGIERVGEVPPSWEDVIAFIKKRHPDRAGDWTRIELEYQIFCRHGAMAGLWQAAHAAALVRKIGMVGPGRGSVCASRLAYALGITDVDPSQYDLSVERFVGGRLGMPDIDIDVERRKRDEMVRALAESGLRAAGLVMRTPWQGTTALQEVSKKHGVRSDVLRRAVEAVGEGTVEDAVKKGRLRVTPWIEEAMAIEGRVAARRTHPSGIALKTEDWMALRVEKGLPIVGLTTDDVEAEGRMILDVLSSRSVGIMAECARQESVTPIAAITPTWIGMTQMGSLAMRRMMEEKAPRTIDEIAHLIAAHRPGPRRSGMSDVYFGNKRAAWPERIASRLTATKGALLYQEQWNGIVADILGISLGEADRWRRKVENGVEEERLLALLGEHVGKDDAQRLLLAGKNAFCRAHAIGYATAIARARELAEGNPLGWWVALLREHPEDPHLILRARACGVRVAPPRPAGPWESTIDSGGVRLGLRHLRSLSPAAQKGTPFDHLPESDRLLMVDAGILDGELIQKWGRPLWSARVKERMSIMGIPYVDQGETADWHRACAAEEAAWGIPLILSVMQCYRNIYPGSVARRGEPYVARILRQRDGWVAFDETGLIDALPPPDGKEGLWLHRNGRPIKMVDPRPATCPPPTVHAPSRPAQEEQAYPTCG